MGIQTIGKSMAIGSSPRVRPDTTVTRHWFGALWLSAGIVLIACLGFLTYQELPHLAPFVRQPDASNHPLLLQVDSQGADLRVSWNRSAMAITRAQAGLLLIQDGDSSPRELRLDADQLHTGSVLYSSGSNKVQFSLKLFEPDGRNVSESVLAISPLRAPAPGNDTDSTTPISPASVPSTLSDSSPADTDQLPKVSKAIPATAEAARQALPAAEQNPPGAKTQANDLVPGEVVHQVLPDVPQRARNTLQGTLHVGVRVRVDPSGGVTDATLDSPGPSRYFARQALQAARRWEFGPPKRNGRAVSSEWVLRFEFRRTATRVLPERAAP